MFTTARTMIEIKDDGSGMIRLHPEARNNGKGEVGWFPNFKVTINPPKCLHWTMRKWWISDGWNGEKSSFSSSFVPFLDGSPLRNVFSCGSLLDACASGCSAWQNAVDELGWMCHAQVLSELLRSCHRDIKRIFSNSPKDRPVKFHEVNSCSIFGGYNETEYCIIGLSWNLPMMMGI